MLHHHLWETVVSEGELLYQLSECSHHDNLLMLLFYGKEIPDYEIRLMRASLKFELIGSMVYPVSDSETDKPPAEVYVRELFQGMCETADDIKIYLERITGKEVSYEDAEKTFRKLVFIINTCCPVMSETYEIRWESTYRCFIEYAIMHDDFGTACPDGIWDCRGGDSPVRGSLQDVLLKVPEELALKVINEDSCDNPIRW